MIQKLKSYLLTAVALLTLAAPAIVPSVAYAACNDIGNGIATGASGVTGGTVSCSNSGSVGNDDIAKVAKGIVNTFSIIVGITAVIMIIIGGFRYITSGGDSGRVGNAKNSLIYAILGLVIVALAQLIVHFVLGQTSTITQ